jgi:uncharacterized protein (DUF433 family)
MSVVQRISVDPAVAHGSPVVRGTRMRVSDILSLLASGASEDEILEDHPYLTREDIRAAITYAAMQNDHAILIAS